MHLDVVVVVLIIDAVEEVEVVEMEEAEEAVKNLFLQQILMLNWMLTNQG